MQIGTEESRQQQNVRRVVQHTDMRWLTQTKSHFVFLRKKKLSVLTAVTVKQEKPPLYIFIEFSTLYLWKY